jgi:hypothetical protein
MQMPAWRHFVHPIVRLGLGLAAGLLTVFLFDRFVWPGTLQAGAIGVIVAVAVVALASRRDAS